MIKSPLGRVLVLLGRIRAVSVGSVWGRKGPDNDSCSEFSGKKVALLTGELRAVFGISNTEWL